MNSTVVKIHDGEIFFVDGSKNELESEPKLLQSLEGYKTLSKHYPEDWIKAVFSDFSSEVIITTESQS